MDDQITSPSNTDNVPPTPPTISTPPTPPTPQIQSQKLDWTKISLVAGCSVLLLFVGALIGVFMSQKNASQVQPIQESQPETIDQSITLPISSIPTQIPPEEKQGEIVNAALGIKFQYPPNWTRGPNLNPEEEVITLKDSCTITIGKGGGRGGPSAELTNEDVSIANKRFDKRTWTNNSQVIFIAYLPIDHTQVIIEYVWVEPLNGNVAACLSESEKILTTLEFTN